MSYRRKPPDPATPREWRSWIDRNAEILRALGLPLDLYSDHSSWEDFLSTGSAVYGPARDRQEFDFNTMTIDQQRRLHEFLENDLGTRERIPGLLGFLRVRASQDWTPPYK